MNLAPRLAHAASSASHSFLRRSQPYSPSHRHGHIPPCEPPAAAPDPPPLPSLMPAPIYSPPPPAMSIPSLRLPLCPSRPGAPPPEPLLCRLRGLPHAVIRRRSSHETPRFQGARFATPTRAPHQPTLPAWAISHHRYHCIQDGPKGTFAPSLSSPGIGREWHAIDLSALV
jgi:hypothetical protein